MSTFYSKLLVLIQTRDFDTVTNGPRPNQLILSKTIQMNINDNEFFEVELFGIPKSTWEPICIYDVACSDVSKHQIIQALVISQENIYFHR